MTKIVHPKGIDPATARLPLGWDRHRSSTSGDLYFLCRETKHTQWHFPFKHEVDDPWAAKDLSDKNKAAAENARQAVRKMMEILMAFSHVSIAPWGKGEIGEIAEDKIEVEFLYGLKIYLSIVGVTVKTVAPGFAMVVLANGSKLFFTKGDRRDEEGEKNEHEEEANQEEKKEDEEQANQEEKKGDKEQDEGKAEDMCLH